MQRAEIEGIFRQAVNKPIDLERFQTLTQTLKEAGKKASPEDRIELAAQLAHAAFLAPDHIADVYDAVTTNWLERELNADRIATLNTVSEPAPDGLWQNFWNVVEDAADGKLDALAITERTAALGGEMPEAFVRRVAEMSHSYPGVSDASRGDLPAKIDLETLAQQPAGSIGAEFHHLIVSNAFDLEVLDRSEIGLAALPTPLDYLNTRILQAHDLWHITAGYETTALHEIALSAFQMAQFGHNYSAQFLAVVFAVGAISPASGYKVLMDTVTTSWAHGRETYPMMLIPWEDVWHKSADEIRSQYAIQAYERPYRADLIERTAPIANLIRKINNLFSVFSRKPKAVTT
ncbi:MAG: Coq4 family protein [Pseudomonadota bacterium]